MDHSWDRQPDEPARWYRRFLHFRDLGPQRSLAAAYAAVAQQEGLTGPTLPAKWLEIAARWCWDARAIAWDTWTASLFTGDAPLPSDPNLRRIAVVERLLGVVYDGIVQANLRGLSEEEARRTLPTLRGLLGELLRAHHKEQVSAQRTARAAIAPFSADELRQAQAELQAEAIPVSDPPWLPLRDVLAELYGDEASARRIAAQAHLDVGHIAFGPRALDCWHAILTEAVRSGQVAAVIRVALAEYAGNVALLRAALAALERSSG